MSDEVRELASMTASFVVAVLVVLGLASCAGALLGMAWRAFKVVGGIE